MLGMFLMLLAVLVAPTLELARRGYRVIGVDVHEEMLEVAREKAAKEGLDVKFVRCDARELRFVEEFDAVTMFFSSLPYMTTYEDLMRLLRGVYRALRPGDVLVADEPNPLAFAYRLGRKEGPTVWDVEHGDEKLVIIDWRELEDVNAIVHFKRVVMMLKPDGTSRTYSMHDRLRLYTAHELKTAAKEAGFSHVRIYGDFKLSDEEPRNANRLFLVARK